MNADRWIAIYQTLNGSATLAPRIFIQKRLGLAASLQAFSVAILCMNWREICETMDFYPFFRINRPAISAIRAYTGEDKAASPNRLYERASRAILSIIRPVKYRYLSNFLDRSRWSTRRRPGDV
jgi:hypothetical protein